MGTWVLQDGETVHIGNAARAQSIANPFNTFHSVKRLIGRSYKEVLPELPSLTYAVVEAFDGSAEIWCPAWYCPETFRVSLHLIALAPCG